MISAVVQFIWVLLAWTVVVPDTTIRPFGLGGVFMGQIVDVDGNMLYKGVVLDNSFNKTVGFWDSDEFPTHIMNTDGSSDTLYYDIEIIQDSILLSYTESYHMSQTNTKLNGWQSLGIVDGSTIVGQKVYLTRAKKWVIDDYRIKTGSIYNSKELYDVTWERGDGVFMFLSFLGIFVLGIAMFFRPIIGKHKLLLPEKVSWIVGAILVVVYCFLNSFIRKQIATPILFFLVPYLLCRLIQIRKVRRIVRLLLCVVIMIGGECYQFLYLNDRGLLSDGNQVQLHWRRGTDVLKRFHIKKIINNMIPVQVEAPDQSKYTIYVNKYEFSKKDQGIVMDELFSCIPNRRPVSGVAYREAQLCTEKLSELSGLHFDLPRLDEVLWAEKSEPSYDVAPLYDEKKVHKGKPNAFGLVNLASNVPEYSSSYSNLKQRISLSGDTLVKSYDFIFTYGTIGSPASEKKKEMSFGAVNKNYGTSNVGFRVIYRPNDIGKRDFIIKGVLHNDKVGLQFPKNIQLIALDGEKVAEMPNYETFQERLIESRFREKTITGIDLSNNQTVYLKMPIGLEFYDFIPYFSFR